MEFFGNQKRKINRMRQLLHAFCLLILFSQLIWPQSTGIIQGLAYDTEGNPIPALNVILIGTNRGDATDADGQFIIQGIQPGTYTVAFEHISFKPRHIENLVIREDTLNLGTVTLERRVIPIHEVVVTATRSDRRVVDVSRSVNIVPAWRIEERNAKTSAEALREETGIFIQKTSHGGGSAIIRGLSSNQVLLLVDGVRLNNSTYRLGNHQYLTTVDNFIVDRLEVVRGPTSVLYGSDALGGTVNAITKIPTLTNAGPAMNFRIGSQYASADQEKTARADITLHNHRWALLTGFSYKDYGDLRRGGNSSHPELENATDGRIQRPTGFSAYDLDTKLVYSLKPEQRFIIAYQMAKRINVPRYDKYENNGYFRWVYTPQNRNLVYMTYENTSKDKFFSSLRASVSYHIQEEGCETQKKADDPLTKEHDKVGTLGLALQLDSEFRRHRLSYGVDIYTDDVSSNSRTIAGNGTVKADERGRYPDNATYTSIGAFFQDEIRIANTWTATAGVRASRFATNFTLDQTETYAGPGNIDLDFQSLTGSLGIVRKITETFFLDANIGQAFRAPNLSDLAKLGESKGDTYEVPNADLTPEKMVSVDIGFKLQSASVSSSASAYYARITDLITSADAVWNGSGEIDINGAMYKVKSKQNIGDAYIRGLEGSVQIDLYRNLSCYGNITTTYGHNTTGDEPVGGIPPTFGLAGLEWRKGEYHLAAYVRFAGDQDRLSTDDRDDPRIPESGTPGWITLNLRGGFPLRDRLGIRLAIENILDLNYREHGSGINGPGRNFIISMTLNN